MASRFPQNQGGPYGKGRVSENPATRQNQEVIIGLMNDIIKSGSGGGGGVSIDLGITGAEVGQVAQIASVDDSGNPTSWEAGDSYTLPTMSADTKGGAKLGSGLKVDNDVLSADEDLGISGASVGQVAVIASVDENGKPTSWEPTAKQGLIADAANVLMEDSADYSFLGKVTDGEGVADVKSIKGNTLVWNQQFPSNASKSSNGIVMTNNGDGSYTLDGTADGDFVSIGGGNINIINDHKYLLTGAKGNVQVQVFQYGVGGSYAPIIFVGSSGTQIARLVVSNGDTVQNVTIYPQLFDLTLMFGAGNEPSTVDEFEALFPKPYYPYDAGSLLSVNMEGVRTVGFNQWDEEWESGGIYYETGGNSSTAGYYRSSYFTVSPSTTYYIKAPASMLIFYYNESKSFLGNSGVAIDNTTFTTPANARFMRFRNDVVNAWVPYNHDICVNLSDPSKNGTYEPYRRNELDIPVSTYFPDGMKSAGTAYDELKEDKAIKRLGSVDLGTLNCSKEVSENYGTYFAFDVQSLGIKRIGSYYNTVYNMRCDSYDVCARNVSAFKSGCFCADGNASSVLQVQFKNDAYSSGDASAFKAAMSGVYLYYELAEPVETPINPPLDMAYRVEQGGIESIIVPDGEMSAPPTLSIAYGKRAQAIVADALAAIADPDGPVATAGHGVGTYLVMDGLLYKVTSAIAIGEAIKPGINVTQTTVMAELLSLTA